MIAPIGRLVDAGVPLCIGDGGPGAVTMELRRRMFDVQYGRVEDAHAWRSPVRRILRDEAIDPEQLGGDSVESLAALLDRVREMPE